MQVFVNKQADFDGVIGANDGKQDGWWFWFLYQVLRILEKSVTFAKMAESLRIMGITRNSRQNLILANI